MVLSLDLIILSEMMTVSSRLSNLETSADIDTDTDYLKIAKKGGGHKGKDDCWEKK